MPKTRVPKTKSAKTPTPKKFNAQAQQRIDRQREQDGNLATFTKPGTTAEAASVDDAGKKNAVKAKVAKPKPVGASKPARLSALDAAAQVLGSAKEPMNVKDLLAKIEAQDLWKSPGGKTPSATLAAALIREIRDKGTASRFRKAGRGLFAARGNNGKAS